MHLVSANSASMTSIAVWSDLEILGAYSQFNGTFPGAHTQNQAEVDMLAALGNILVAKLLNDLKKLLEMEILCTRHDINHFVKFVGFVLWVVNGLIPAVWSSMLGRTPEMKVDLLGRAIRRYHG